VLDGNPNKRGEKIPPLDSSTILTRANFKTPDFGQYLRQTQILILKILNVFLWLKFSSSLLLTKLERFETTSLVFFSINKLN